MSREDVLISGQRWGIGPSQAQALSFELDEPGAAFPFSARLQQEQHSWSEEFARRAIVEYKRFMFLAATSSQELTPSVEVDQVWHLHLLYTRSYRELCGLLGTFIHHGPTRGGPAENSKFHEQYRNTLRRYKGVFGEPPPPDIWPTPKVRFRSVAGLQWVDLDEHVVLRRTSLKALGWSLIGLAVLLAFGAFFFLKLG